jgi:hypothetical protein
MYLLHSRPDVRVPPGGGTSAAHMADHPGSTHQRKDERGTGWSWAAQRGEGVGMGRGLRIKPIRGSFFFFILLFSVFFSFYLNSNFMVVCLQNKYLI